MTKPTNRRGTEREPFTTIDVRAVIDATPEEQAVILAIQFLHWWLGPAEAKGLELIEAVLRNPQRPDRVPAGEPGCKEELGQISPRAIKRALARLRARGWVETERAFKGPTSYRLTVPTLAFKDSYETVAARLSPAIRARLAQRAVEPSGQLGLSLGPARPDGGASSAQGLLSNQTLRDQTKKREEPAADKPLGGQHPEQDATWTEIQKTWTDKHPGAPALKWPAATMRGWQAALGTELQRLGKDELVRRWANMVNDPWAKASLRAFISDTDAWIKRRVKEQQKQTRGFHQPATEGWRPTLGDK